MSIRVNADVYDFGPEDPTDCHVLLALSTHCNDDGLSCYPSIARIAKMARCSERSVQRSISTMEAEGWIRVTRGNGRGHISEYEINVQKLKGRQRDTLFPELKGRHGDTFSELEGCQPVTLSKPERVTLATVKGDTDGLHNRKNRHEPSTKTKAIPVVPFFPQVCSPESQKPSAPPIEKPPERLQAVATLRRGPLKIPEPVALVVSPPGDGLLALAAMVVCAHPRAIQRNLLPGEVDAREADAVLCAARAEMERQGIDQRDALKWLHDRTQMLAENVPRSEWNFFKAIPAFYRAFEYRKEPEDFAGRVANGTFKGKTESSLEAARAAIAAIAAFEAAGDCETFDPAWHSPSSEARDGRLPGLRRRPGPLHA